MDLFYKAISTFLDLLSFGYLAFQWSNRKLSCFIKNILVCVSKFNQSLMVLEQHEGEEMMMNSL